MQTFDNYIAFFKGLKTELSTKKERRIYDNFIRVFNDLNLRDFNDAELTSIHNELELINLQSDTNTKVLSKKLQQLLAYLKQKFNLITIGHYANTYMPIGMCLGLVFGMALGPLSLTFGLLIGMVIGMALGSEKDKKAKAEGQVMDVKTFESCI
ncbi:hypothetical protein V6251_03635 [Olleya sp. Ti.3.14]|uniref:hypothetical protein n=1 Tax=Olleya sp. Ti.3.14 TaxID=3121297 RepID=UPI00311D3597